MDHPNVISFLSGFAGAIDRMDADIFSILGLPGMDDDCDMDIVSDADISQFGHEGVLKFKLFEPFSLLRYHKLEGIKDYRMNVVLLDAINDGRKDFIDVC
mgnify:CR=1 FL=1